MSKNWNKTQEDAEEPEEAIAAPVAETGLMKIVLNYPHTHAGVQKNKFDTLEVDAVTGKWLISVGHSQAKSGE